VPVAQAQPASPRGSTRPLEARRCWRETLALLDPRRWQRTVQRLVLPPSPEVSQAGQRSRRRISRLARRACNEQQRESATQIWRNGAVTQDGSHRREAGIRLQGHSREGGRGEGYRRGAAHRTAPDAWTMAGLPAGGLAGAVQKQGDVAVPLRLRQAFERPDIRQALAGRAPGGIPELSKLISLRWVVACDRRWCAQGFPADQLALIALRRASIAVCVRVQIEGGWRAIEPGYARPDDRTVRKIGRLGGGAAEPQEDSNQPGGLPKNGFCSSLVAQSRLIATAGCLDRVALRFQDAVQPARRRYRGSWIKRRIAQLWQDGRFNSSTTGSAVRRGHLASGRPCRSARRARSGRLSRHWPWRSLQQLFAAAGAARGGRKKGSAIGCDLQGSTGAAPASGKGLERQGRAGAGPCLTGCEVPWPGPAGRCSRADQRPRAVSGFADVAGAPGRRCQQGRIAQLWRVAGGQPRGPTDRSRRLGLLGRARFWPSLSFGFVFRPWPGGGGGIGIPGPVHHLAWRRAGDQRNAQAGLTSPS